MSACIETCWCLVQDAQEAVETVETRIDLIGRKLKAAKDKLDTLEKVSKTARGNGGIVVLSGTARVSGGFRLETWVTLISVGLGVFVGLEFPRASITCLCRGQGQMAILH